MEENESPILITGASGFVGSWVVARLLSEGENVVALDLKSDLSRLEKLSPKNHLDNVSWIAGDISDYETVLGAVQCARPKAIIHLAALQIPACKASPSLGAAVNIVGHINIFEAARKCGIGSVIYSSSAAAKPRGEAHAPANFYGVFKKTGEEIARLYWSDHGIASIGLRPHVVYGLGRDEGETSAITSAIRAAAEGKPYEMPFSGISCLQYAGEIADIFVRLTRVHLKGAMLSDMSADMQSTDDVISAIKAIVPEARINRSNNYRESPSEFDNSPLLQLIGDWPKVDLVTGVEETVNLYRGGRLN